MVTANIAHEELELPDALNTVNDTFYRNGWTDGLPIIPPTRDRVDAMLAAARLDGDHLVAEIPPKMGRATAEKIAINAVMAGCLPEYMPVLVAAVAALADERYGLEGRQTTTHAGAPLLIVNGPIVKRLGINYGAGCFGPGWRPNATIGRAVRLVLMNVGGAIPGEIDSATHGHPGKYTYCIAENEDASPWEPLHVERGFPREASTVTVVNAEAPHSINDNRSQTARGVLATCASTMSALGVNNLYYQGQPILVLGPEHAAKLARDGFSKYDVKAYLYEKARQPASLVRGRGMEVGKDFPRWLDLEDDREMVPIAHRADDIVVIVAGGGGAKSMCVPTAGRQSWSVTKAIP